jgi:hypothetical protein
MGKVGCLNRMSTPKCIRFHEVLLLTVKTKDHPDGSQAASVTCDVCLSRASREVEVPREPEMTGKGLQEAR